MEARNRRILIVDDSQAIHDVFRRLLRARRGECELEPLDPSQSPRATATHLSVTPPRFELSHAYQGEEALEKVARARAEGRPFAVTFLDVVMPPGWDGLKTATELWNVDPELLVVLCTGHADPSWEELLSKLGRNDRYLILKKPFEGVEVKQLSLALTEKWALARRARRRTEELELRVVERTAALEQTNAELVREAQERRRMQLELLRAQKLEAMGQLVAGVAHEINNPLSFVLSNLEHLEAEARKPGFHAGDGHGTATFREILKDAAIGAERIRLIVQDLKVFSRDRDDAPGAVDLHEAIHSALNLAGRELSKRGQLQLELAPVPQVIANASRLGQVLLNLLVNASHALPQDRVEDNVIQISTRLADDGWVECDIEDNGHGMTPEVRKRAFDPFFTTKPVGLGTGLGLSICHGIMESFGGSIVLTSEPEVGTSMRLRLKPAPMDAAEREEPATAS